MRLHLTDLQRQAQDNLLDAIKRVVEETGQGVVCWDKDLWTSDEPEDRRAAAEACGFCPVRAECFVMGKTLRATAGVFGGKDFTPTRAMVLPDDEPDEFAAPPTHKVCRRCGGRKPLEDFHNNRRSKDGKRNDCAVCTRFYEKSLRQRKKEEAKAS